MKDTVQEISLNDIYLDRETQIRSAVSEETILRYFDVMADTEGRDKFPPILLFQDEEGNYWLADGHHRVMAAKRRKFTSILAIVRPGTKADAIWEAAKSNSRNGLPLGRADLRRAVEMICAAFSDRSNRMIADTVGCDEKTVRKYRPEKAVANDSTADKSAVEKTVGKDGKRRSATRTSKSTKPKTAYSVASQSPSVAKEVKRTPSSPIPANDGRVAETRRVAEPLEETNAIENSDDRRRIEAHEKESQIETTISLLRRQIDEWFEIALDDMYEEFDQRVRKQLLAIVD